MIVLELKKIIEITKNDLKNSLGEDFEKIFEVLESKLEFALEYSFFEKAPLKRLGETAISEYNAYKDVENIKLAYENYLKETKKLSTYIENNYLFKSFIDTPKDINIGSIEGTPEFEEAKKNLLDAIKLEKKTEAARAEAIKSIQQIEGYEKYKEQQLVKEATEEAEKQINAAKLENLENVKNTQIKSLTNIIAIVHEEARNTAKQLFEEIYHPYGEKSPYGQEVSIKEAYNNALVNIDKANPDKLVDLIDEFKETIITFKNNCKDGFYPQSKVTNQTLKSKLRLLPIDSNYTKNIKSSKDTTITEKFDYVVYEGEKYAKYGNEFYLFEKVDWIEGKGIRCTQKVLDASIWDESFKNKDFYNETYINEYINGVINKILIESGLQKTARIPTTKELGPNGECEFKTSLLRQAEATEFAKARWNKNYGVKTKNISTHLNSSNGKANYWAYRSQDNKVFAIGYNGGFFNEDSQNVYGIRLVQNI